MDEKPARVCGGCTACCKTHEVPELKKPFGVWCGHCDIGVGCKVYDDRPKGCRAFRCQWLLSDALSEKERPDRSKIVIDCRSADFLGPAFKDREWHQLFEVSEGALESRFGRWIASQLLSVRSFVSLVPLVGEVTLRAPLGERIPPELPEIFARFKRRASAT